MKKLNFLITILVLIQTIILSAQEYNFISNDFHLMTDEEMMTHQVQFGANIAMFDVDGNSIEQSQINDLMMSGNFTPIVFGDSNHKPKAIVFRATTKEEKEQMKTAFSNEDPNANFKAGILAEDFTTTDLNGEKVSLSNLKGKIVVLNFWFTTCEPCIKEIPELNKLVKKYKKQGVQFIAITFNKDTDLKKFFSKNKFDFTIVSDMDIIKKYKVDSYPTSMIIDRNGEFIFRKIGVFTEEIDTKIGQLLK